MNLGNKTSKETIFSFTALVLVCAWPFLNILLQNIHVIFDITPFLINISLIAACICALSYLLSFLFKKSILRINSVLTLALIFIFSYSAISDKLGKHLITANLHGFSVSFTGIWALFVLVCLLIIWNKSRFFFTRNIVILIAFVLGLTPLSQVIFYATKQSLNQKNIVNSGNETLLTTKFKHHNNVYFLLLDAYGREDTLKNQMNYHNEHFLASLSKKGFVISDKSYSNYHFTLASLSSMFNMNYHELDPNGIEQRTAFNVPLRGYNKVIETFRKNKYKYILVPSGRWSEIDCSGVEDMCIAAHANVELVNNIIELTPLRKISNYLKKTHYMDFEDVEKAIHAFPNDPKFVFAHFAQVHDTVYNENCEITRMGHPVICCENRIKEYTNSINCVNKKLLIFIDKIIASDPDAIIVIQADHGPTIVAKNDEKACEYWLKNFWDLKIKSNEEFKNMYGVLSAIRIPNKNEQTFFYSSISPVNLFRGIFAYLQEEKPNYIQDKSFLLYEDSQKKGIYLGKNVDEFRN